MTQKTRGTGFSLRIEGKMDLETLTKTIVEQLVILQSQHKIESFGDVQLQTEAFTGDNKMGFYLVGKDQFEPMGALCLRSPEMDEIGLSKRTIDPLIVSEVVASAQEKLLPIDLPEEASLFVLTEDEIENLKRVDDGKFNLQQQQAANIDDTGLCLRDAIVLRSGYQPDDEQYYFDFYSIKTIKGVEKYNIADHIMGDVEFPCHRLFVRDKSTKDKLVTKLFDHRRQLIKSITH
jgi:hypothetical protein